MSETLLKLGPNDTGMRISARDFAGADWQSPYRFERVRGRVVVMSPANPEHRYVGGFLRRELDAYWKAHPDIVVFVDVEGWVATSPHDDRLPDVCVYLRGSSDGDRMPHRVPDLVFEIVSESRRDQERDYIFKREEYHGIGVREYVILDRFKQAALVMTWKPDDYAERAIRADGVYETPLLPGFTASMRDILPASPENDR